MLDWRPASSTGQTCCQGNAHPCRAVISFDGYFAQRAYMDQRRPAGVVILKFKPRNIKEVFERLNERLLVAGDLQGKLIVT